MLRLFAAVPVAFLQIRGSFGTFEPWHPSGKGCQLGSSLDRIQVPGGLCLENKESDYRREEAVFTKDVGTVCLVQ